MCTVGLSDVNAAGNREGVNHDGLRVRRIATSACSEKCPGIVEYRYCLGSEHCRIEAGISGSQATARIVEGHSRHKRIRDGAGNVS